MELINQILAYLAKPEIAASVAFVIEMAMRLFPTAKPWSILHAAKRVVRAIAVGLGVVADFLDKVLPQNVQDPQLPNA